MKKEHGYTLIESLIVMSIAALLGAVSIPSFTRVIQSNQAEASIRHVYTAFQQARSAAISKGKTITFCGSNDGTNCEKEWNQYLLAFVDVNDNRVYDEDEDEELILNQYFGSDATLITRMSFGLTYTKLNRDGSTKYQGSVVYCPENNNPEFVKRTTWNRVGRPYLGIDQDEDGIIDTTGGDPLSEWCK